MILTADCRRRLEDSGNLWIDVNHDVLRDCNLLMSSVDLCLHPIVESILQDSSADVGDPLLGRLGQLKIRLWQILEHVAVVLSQELHDLLQSKPFVPVDD